MIVLDDRRTPAGTDARPLTGRDMLCFSHDWSGDPLSLMTEVEIVIIDGRVTWRKAEKPLSVSR